MQRLKGVRLRVCLAQIQAERLAAANPRLRNLQVGDFEYVPDAMRLGAQRGNRFEVTLRCLLARSANTWTTGCACASVAFEQWCLNALLYRLVWFQPLQEATWTCNLVLHIIISRQMLSEPHPILSFAAIQGAVRGGTGGCGDGLRDAAHTRFHQLLWPAALWQWLFIHAQAGARLSLCLFFMSIA